LHWESAEVNAILEWLGEFDQNGGRPNLLSYKQNLRRTTCAEMMQDIDLLRNKSGCTVAKLEAKMDKLLHKYRMIRQEEGLGLDSASHTDKTRRMYFRQIGMDLVS
jgi:hypothetical protein